MNNQSISIDKLSIDKRFAGNSILYNNLNIKRMILKYGRLYKKPKSSLSFFDHILRVINPHNIGVSAEFSTTYIPSSSVSKNKKKKKEGIENRGFLGTVGAVIFLSTSYFIGRVWDEYNNVRDDLREERKNAEFFFENEIEYKLSVNINQPIMKNEKDDAWNRLAAKVAILVSGLGIFGAAVIDNKMLMEVSGIVTVLGMGCAMFIWGCSNRVIDQNKRILALAANKKLMLEGIMPPQNPQYTINPSKATQNTKIFNTYPEPSAPPLSPRNREIQSNES